MNCEQVREFLELGADSPTTADDLRHHLAGCTVCREFESHVAWEDALLTATFKRHETPDDYIDTLLTTLRREVAQPHTPQPGALSRRRGLSFAASFMLLFGGYTILGATGLVPWPWDLFGSAGSPQSHPVSASDPQTGRAKNRTFAERPERPLGTRLTLGGNAVPNNNAYDAMFFTGWGIHPQIDTEDEPVSRFAADTDTGAYTLTRKYLSDGHLPPRELIRVEEFLNRFDYGDKPPEGGPLSVHLECAPSPFSNRRYLFRIAVRGAVISHQERPPANVVLLIDVSGSMNRGGRLARVKSALARFIAELRPDDRVAVVTFGRKVTVQHELALLGRNETIFKRLASIIIEPGSPEIGDTTNIQIGLKAAYRIADVAQSDDRFARIVLASDGVANTGLTSGPKLASLARPGVTLTTVGVGTGNYNDVLMEQLADKADGTYLYLDRAEEADRIAATLQTVARDVRFEVAFNPHVVAQYRLLGYENRAAGLHTGHGTRTDGGEIAAGQTVTALYEIRLVKNVAPKELAVVAIHYTTLVNNEVVPSTLKSTLATVGESYENGSPALKLTASIAWSCERLRKSIWGKGTDWEVILPRLKEAADAYKNNREVAEFVQMIEKASRLQNETRQDR